MNEQRSSETGIEVSVARSRGRLGGNHRWKAAEARVLPELLSLARTDLYSDQQIERDFLSRGHSQEPIDAAYAKIGGKISPDQHQQSLRELFETPLGSNGYNSHAA
jgi:hypothetical protein